MRDSPDREKRCEGQALYQYYTTLAAVRAISGLNLKTPSGTYGHGSDGLLFLAACVGDSDWCEMAKCASSRNI